LDWNPPRGRALEDRESLHLVAEIGDLQSGDRPVLALAEGDEVEDSDQAAVDEVEQMRATSPVGWRPGHSTRR
jgi:hypothetical protein